MSGNHPNNIPFIPARESPFFIFFFRVYVKYLFKRRFHQVWIHQEYKPIENDKTVYFLNHTSWWDGLIPFLLNEFLFHQKARAMMEDKQMVEFTFFKKIGAFSVSKDDKKKAVSSIRYALDSMKRKNSSLFIFPQGKIVPEHQKNIEFENGIGWLQQQCTDCHFVPITISMHTMRSDKPEIFINIGKPVNVPEILNSKQRTMALQDIITKELNNLEVLSGIENPEQHFKIFL